MLLLLLGGCLVAGVFQSQGQFSAAANSSRHSPSAVERSQNSCDAAAVDEPKPAAEAKGPTTPIARFRNELVRGKVVWMAEALRDEFGISTVPEAAEHNLALLTNDGQLLPIVEDLRGRAFRKDERLRGRDLEILARRHDRHPLIQILRIYEFEDGKRYEVDYWCDVCAIVMFEQGPCSCCQDDNRMRQRLAPDEPGDPRNDVQPGTRD